MGGFVCEEIRLEGTSIISVKWNIVAMMLLTGKDALHLSASFRRSWVAPRMVVIFISFLINVYSVTVLANHGQTDEVCGTPGMPPCWFAEVSNDHSADTGAAPTEETGQGNVNFQPKYTLAACTIFRDEVMCSS